jgi:hypothetical protein
VGNSTCHDDGKLCGLSALFFANNLKIAWVFLDDDSFQGLPSFKKTVDATRSTRQSQEDGDAKSQEGMSFHPIVEGVGHERHFHNTTPAFRKYPRTLSISSRFSGGPNIRKHFGPLMAMTCVLASLRRNSRACLVRLAPGQASIAEMAGISSRRPKSMTRPKASGLGPSTSPVSHAHSYSLQAGGRSG